ncbi:MAG: hypothetical protein KF723_02510 [Rhizobiaceae bacterium]|nr:hypothetical protein [Rhizobiaceae bacterium]
MDGQVRVKYRPEMLARLLSVLAAFSLALLLLGCAIRLAPDYDQSIVDGLEAANEEAMVLFAATANGAAPGTFGEREAAYNALIGKLDSLRVTAQARPDPASFAPAGGMTADIATLESPTPQVLSDTVQPIVFMRDNDRAGMLTAAVVQGIKQSFEIHIARALIYEKALRR